MRFVAIVRSPPHAEEAAKAMAAALGLTRAETQMRMAAEPPALVARLQPDAANELVTALRQVGVAALSVDEQVPSDKDRIIARSFTFTADGATFTPRSAAPIELAWHDVVALLRGLRARRLEVEHTNKTKSLSVATALATGGLKMTRTSTKTTRSSEETSEQVVLVYPREGRTVLLSEREVDFNCLGPGLRPSSTLNIVELTRRLSDSARTAFYDDRLLRLGRRPLPFLAERVSRSSTQVMSVAARDSSSSLDVLAEIMFQAVRQRLLP